MLVRFQADADLDGLLVRNVHLRIAAELCGIHGRRYLTNMTLHDSPLRVAKHNDGDGAALQILLRHPFLSVVIRISKPASSAAFSNSPLTSRSQSASLAFVTEWPMRNGISGAGVP